MIAQQTSPDTKRLTTTEEVFRQLKSDIISLQLPPGSKISEVEVAKSCDVSRQPVREAFMRLGELNLLEIRPQRATRVRKISHQDLRNTRFIRAAVEIEIVRVACHVATPEGLALLQENLNQQHVAVAAGDAELLHTLDYEFHKLICVAADCSLAFKTIDEIKTHTDRVCMLELSDAEGRQEVLEGHTDIFNAICEGDEEEAVKMTRTHLKHLDGTLASACEKFPDFFED
ncbi:MAG: DNA-binding GntR family transcriptional regulator [Ascidiaceihabitans sp.]|jgi:DNA-binding GntR family transcriptional regulator